MARRRSLGSALRVALGASTGSEDEAATRLLEALDRRDLLPLITSGPRRIGRKLDSFLRVLDQLAADAGKRCWVEKTPSHVHYLDVLDRHAPEIDVVHIYREGTAVVASLWDTRQRYPEAHWPVLYPSLHRCVERWRSAIQCSIAYAGEPRHHLIRYEWLVRYPEWSCRRLAGALQLDFHPAMVLSNARPNAHLFDAREPWKLGTDLPLGTTGADRFEELLDGNQRRFVIEHLLPLDDLDARALNAIRDENGPQVLKG